MQSKAVFLLSTACIFASAPLVDAQVVYDGPQIPSRFSVGADFTVSQPKGEFADNVPTGYGFDVTGLFRIDPKDWFSIRGDVGGVRYGHEHLGLSFPTTGRVDLSLNTDNQIGFGALGLQLQISDGWFRPYASASYAAVDFWTESECSAVGCSSLLGNRSARSISGRVITTAVGPRTSRKATSPTIQTVQSP